MSQEMSHLLLQGLDSSKTIPTVSHFEVTVMQCVLEYQTESLYK